MKSRRLLALAFATSLLVAVSPTMALAQGATTTSTGGASTAANSATGGGGTNLGSSTTSSTLVSVPTQSISSGTGSTTTIPSNSNPFASSYVNPFSVGQPSKYQTTFGAVKPTGTFGVAQYVTTTTTNAAGTASSQQTTANGFTTFGQFRSPVYATVLSDDLPPVAHKVETLYADVKAAIERSSHITSKNNIQVNVISGGAVVLTGQVANEKEYRIAEAQVRFTPGVRNVQNDLKIMQPK